MFRRKGISLLIPTQNVEKTIELCLRSFKDFPDEIIVVDNGSTDNTIDIVRGLTSEIPKMKFYEAPHLKDLYENRQYAFERSKYEWIVRIDSDYIAYTSGPYDIKFLRERIMNSKPTIRPKAFGITQVNLESDFLHTGTPFTERPMNLKHHVHPPMNTLAYRIIQWYPGMRFQRLGRWEGVRFQGTRLFLHTMLQDPHWFHCTQKSRLDYLIRSERNNWRELGDFQKYPTRELYINEVVIDKYGVDSIEEAADIYWKKMVVPYIIPYEESKYYPYPDIIKKIINK